MCSHGATWTPVLRLERGAAVASMVCDACGRVTQPDFLRIPHALDPRPFLPERYVARGRFLTRRRADGVRNRLAKQYPDSPIWVVPEGSRWRVRIVLKSPSHPPSR